MLGVRVVRHVLNTRPTRQTIDHFQSEATHAMDAKDVIVSIGAVVVVVFLVQSEKSWRYWLWIKTSREGKNLIALQSDGE